MPSDRADICDIGHHLPANTVLNAHTGVVEHRTLSILIQCPVDIRREDESVIRRSKELVDVAEGVDRILQNGRVEGQIPRLRRWRPRIVKHAGTAADGGLAVARYVPGKAHAGSEE